MENSHIEYSGKQLIQMGNHLASTIPKVLMNMPIRTFLKFAPVSFCEEIQEMYGTQLEEHTVETLMTCQVLVKTIMNGDIKGYEILKKQAHENDQVVQVEEVVSKNAFEMLEDLDIKSLQNLLASKIALHEQSLKQLE